MDFFEEDLEKLEEISDTLLAIRGEIEARYSPDLLDKINRQCWIARTIYDPRYGNVMEQISRVESAIKVARKSTKTGDLYTAISRVKHSVEIHRNYIKSTKRT